MRILAAIGVVLALLAVTAALTRPGPEEFDRMVADTIRERIAATDVEGGGDAFGTLALVGCKLRPTDCIEVVRQTMDVTFDEGLFVTRAEVRGFGRDARCIGAFGRFYCGRDFGGG